MTRESTANAAEEEGVARKLFKTGQAEAPKVTKGQPKPVISSKSQVPVADWGISHQQLLIDLSVAQELLRPEDDVTLRKLGGIGVDELINLVRRENISALKLFMGTGKYYPSELNSRGVQVLRVLLTNRIQDWLRQKGNSRSLRSKHEPSIPFSKLYEEFHRDGIVGVDYSVFSGRARSLNIQALKNLTSFVRELTGFHYLHCEANSGQLSFEGEVGRAPDEDKSIRWFATKVRYMDNDPQIVMHVDNLMPRYKIFLFPKAVNFNQGPFHYVPGSHRPSEDKLRWVYDITREQTPESGNLRFNLTDWSYQKQTIGLSTYNFNSAKAFGTKRPFTLVIADTGGFHFRGLQQRNHERFHVRPNFGCTAAVMQKNLYKCLSDREAC